MEFLIQICTTLFATSIGVLFVLFVFSYRIIFLPKPRPNEIFKLTGDNGHYVLILDTRSGPRGSYFVDYIFHFPEIVHSKYIPEVQTQRFDVFKMIYSKVDSETVPNYTSVE